MRVNNINGTSKNICRCGSWLKHWGRYSGQALYKFCSVKFCQQNAEVGAHVQIVNSYNSNWYIIPLCKAHNAEKKLLDIGDGIKPVSANISETCGRETYLG